MKRFGVTLALALAASLAAAEGLKPPAQAPAPPAREQESPNTQYVIMSAELLAQIQALIEAQRREIERLRSAKSTEACI